MTRWSWAVLVFELLLITIILILPQVDIPDTAFHCGTAPVLAKARLTSQPPQTQAGPDLRPVLQSKVNRVFSARTGMKSSFNGPALPRPSCHLIFLFIPKFVHLLLVRLFSTQFCTQSVLC